MPRRLETTSSRSYYPLNFSNRQASYYDPATGEFTLIDTCFATHHLQFDNGPRSATMYFNELLGPIVGWLNTREYDRTGDEQATQGWCPQVVDTQRRRQDHEAVESCPASPIDARRDTEVRHNLYSVIPSPVDDSVWGASEDTFPGYIVRVDLRRQPAGNLHDRGVQGARARHRSARHRHRQQRRRLDGARGEQPPRELDRTKCSVLNGPETLDGTHCQAGWKLYVSDGPRFKGTDIPADFHYYNWVDQHDVAGFGKNTPIATGSNSDALLVLDPESGEWTKLRVPYPLGFYHCGLDGRIDDPNAGWKGRGYGPTTART